MDDDDNDNNDNNAEGFNRSNRTVIRQQYGQPHNWHPAHGPGVVHVKASAGICAGV